MLWSSVKYVHKKSNSIRKKKLLPVGALIDAGLT